MRRRSFHRNPAPRRSRKPSHGQEQSASPCQLSNLPAQIPARRRRPLQSSRCPRRRSRQRSQLRHTLHRLRLQRSSRHRAPLRHYGRYRHSQAWRLRRRRGRRRKRLPRLPRARQLRRRWRLLCPHVGPQTIQGHGPRRLRPLPPKAGLSLETARSRAKNGALPALGAVSVSVPGALDAWWNLHQRYGSKLRSGPSSSSLPSTWPRPASPSLNASRTTSGAI